MESWIVEHRRQTCTACEFRPNCHAWSVPAFFFAEAPECPKGKIASRNAAIAARAWPAGVDPVSGCCDRADQA